MNVPSYEQLLAENERLREEGRKDYEGMREFQQKYIAADQELRKLREESREARRREEMIDTKELRRLAQGASPGPWKMRPVGDGRQKFAVADSDFLPILTVTDEGGATFGTVYDDADAKFIAAANPAAISELLDRLEAAYKEIESWKGLARQFGNEADELRTHLSFAKDELNRSRAKIAEMEKQEPAG